MSNMYYYGMRLRGFSIGCQPKNGLVSVIDGEAIKSTRYYSILVYDRELTPEEIRGYELEEIEVFYRK